MKFTKSHFLAAEYVTCFRVTIFLVMKPKKKKATNGCLKSDRNVNGSMIKQENKNPRSATHIQIFPHKKENSSQLGDSH